MTIPARGWHSCVDLEDIIGFEFEPTPLRDEKGRARLTKKRWSAPWSSGKLWRRCGTRRLASGITTRTGRAFAHVICLRLRIFFWQRSGESPLRCASCSSSSRTTRARAAQSMLSPASEQEGTAPHAKWRREWWPRRWRIPLFRSLRRAPISPSRSWITPQARLLCRHAQAQSACACGRRDGPVDRDTRSVHSTRARTSWTGKSEKSSFQGTGAPWKSDAHLRPASKPLAAQQEYPALNSWSAPSRAHRDGP